MATQTIESVFDFDFEIIGITCQERDYRLVWSLNLALDLGFVREEDHEVKLKTGSSFHARFTSRFEEDNITLTLLSNKGSGGYLLAEYSKFDFVLLMDGVAEEYVSLMSKAIRKVDFVLGVFPLETSKLKSKFNLIIE